MKFAHIADCHIGAWRDPLLSDLSTKAFTEAIKKIKQEQVDFLIIAGDLFNTSLPAIDKLKIVTKELKDLIDDNIPVYMIAGSHDFSPSGKTMLDVLENAGIAINVTKGDIVDDKLRLKFTIDPKTGVKITGMLGKKGGLEKIYYESLEKENLESETGFKIFMFHTLLSELKPKNMEKVDSEPLSLLPKGFDYYAGGHPHFVYNQNHPPYGIITYPGPLFPNSFKEIEDLSHGGFYIVENGKPEWIPIKLHEVEKININCNNKTSEEVKSLLEKEINEKNFENKIVTIRLGGTLEQGKPSDLDFKSIFNSIRNKGAYTILKNSSALSSKEFQDIKVNLKNTEDIENTLISEQIKSVDLKEYNAQELTKKLLKAFDLIKQEGETVDDFEKRLKEEIDQLIN